MQGVTAFAEPILGRDLFNSIPDPKPQPEAPSSHEPRRSELEWKLIATSVASDARWSTAIVRPDERDGRSRIVALGDRVGGAEVLEILAPWLDAQGKHHPARIVVNNDGQLEFLQENNPEPKVRKERKKRKRRRRRRDRRKR